MQTPRGPVPRVVSRRSAHRGRDLDRSVRVFKVVVLAALLVLIAGTLLAIANLPDLRATTPRPLGPSVQYSWRTASSPASRSLTRLPLPVPWSGVNRLLPLQVEGAIPAVHQTAFAEAPAASPSRPAPATELHTSPSASAGSTAAVATPSVPTRSPAAVSVGDTASGPTAQQWATLRRCESGGLYGNKQNPRYRGAYQIGFTEWASYGGTGRDPADAPPAEQDAVALRMWQARGWQPWSSSSKCTHLS